MQTSPQPAGKRDWPRNTAMLLEFSDKSAVKNLWSVNDAFQGTQVFGSTGSGKSTGSGRAIAQAFLRSNFGGLVLTAKTDERAAWEKYAEDTGRKSDLLIFAEDKPHRFNFLHYERTRSGKGSGNTENLVNLFMAVMEVVGESAFS